ncbi:MAG TPA: hypothetical protein VLM75_10920 [Spirochaetota bacterium]|nr:hypothetical protein [Spirochaetota bacterium]
MPEGMLKNSGFEVMEGGPRVLWNPDGDAVARCRDFGRQIVAFFAP